MPRFFITTCALALLTASAPSFAQAAPDAPVSEETSAGDRIVEIRVEGNRRVEAEAIIQSLRQKKGEAFDPSRTQDDIRALWALKYFADIQLLVQRLPDGIAYVVRVDEKPAIHSVTLEGNDELSKDDLKDTVDIKVYSILDLGAVQRNMKKIQDKYIEKGHFLAEVTYQVRPREEGREVDVVFVINEHAKVQVKEVSFIGVENVKIDELKSVMATREGGWLSFLTSEGNYREELLQRDVQVIQAAYLDRGFVNVRVDKPVVSLSPDKRYISIGIRVEEGDQFNIGKIDFSGDLIITKEELIAKLTSRPDTTFNRSFVVKDIQTITDVYYDQGYAYANILPLTANHAATKTLDLTFEVQKGKQVTIERIDIVGNTKTRDKVIRRQLDVFEGELFSGTGMRRSKEKVTALGFFETVEVTHKPGRDDAHVVVQVEIKEKSTGTFQVGLGFSNIESFIFTAQVAQQNAGGWGQSLSASAQLSGLRSFFQLSYLDPYFLDSKFIVSLDAYRTALDYFGFQRDAFGGTVSVGRYITADSTMSVSLGYTLEWVRVEPGRDAQLISDFFRSGRTSAVKASWTWDKRNNRLFPSQGWLSFVQVEAAPAFLGGTFLFNRYTAYQRVYFPLPFGAVLKFNLQAGLVQQLDSKNGLPASELYYLGGIFTLRGYPQRTVTPTQLAASTVDSVARPVGVGGDKQIIFNAELEIPLIEKVGIRGVLFYDAGNAFAQGMNFFQTPTPLPLGLLHSVGFGIRWFSPIGPLRFEWGIPLTRRPGDQPIQFEFTIGNSF